MKKDEDKKKIRELLGVIQEVIIPYLNWKKEAYLNKQ